MTITTKTIEEGSVMDDQEMLEEALHTLHSILNFTPKDKGESTQRFGVEDAVRANNIIGHARSKGWKPKDEKRKKKSVVKVIVLAHESGGVTVAYKLDVLCALSQAKEYRTINAVKNAAKIAGYRPPYTVITEHEPAWESLSLSGPWEPDNTIEIMEDGSYREIDDPRVVDAQLEDVPTPIKVATICSNSSGAPEIVKAIVTITNEDLELGYHCDAVCEVAKNDGYSGPFSSFDEYDPAGVVIFDHLDWSNAVKVRYVPNFGIRYL